MGGQVRLHIGRKAPKGFVELPGAVHMGKGIWMMRIAPEGKSGGLGRIAAKVRKGNRVS